LDRSIPVVIIANDLKHDGMLTVERHRQILRLLRDHGRLTLKEIASKLSVSLATVRRDAVDLATTNRAQRVHGGLLSKGFGQEEPLYSRKAEKAVSTKVRLGRSTATMLPEAGSVFIDAGTTCLEVGRAVLDRPRLRIFTNSLPLLSLAVDSRATIISLGGEVRPLSLALTGSLAQHWLQNLRFDTAVIGASGLDLHEGASTTEAAEAGVKTEALRRASRRILVAHAEKWSQPAAIRFAPWSTFTDLVTDHTLSRVERVTLGGAGLRIHSPSS
jgi:DeoR/GlpR family transcriptional regulator of sugar metabolism